MKITGYHDGQMIRPLEQVVVSEARGVTFRVLDGSGCEYEHGPVQDGSFSFSAGGALGWHSIQTLDANAHNLEQAQFRVDAQTDLSDQGGIYRDLLNMLYLTMVNNPEDSTIRFQNRNYYLFIPWLRDHVHVMKGMKYFAARLQDGIDFFRDSQREDGMIWDNVHRRNPPFFGPDHWSVRFDYGGFFRLFDDGTAEFTRIPVENDVEYLYVESLYYTWKATGDDAWMMQSIPAAKKALEYSITSPYRWSSQYGLLKRGHTIDTWDFQNEEDCLPDFAGWNDPMAIHPDKTRFGIMFGDNTGYAAACQYMAEMLEHAGQAEEAVLYRERGRQIMQRLNQISWNGRFFTHHVPEEPAPQRDLGVDETTQISLSNAYSLNRPITHEQCTAILRTYHELKNHLPPGSPGEWYTIYPPYQKGYGGHNDIWQYMNSSVTPIVAGELAHGAFQHGFEAYGVDILQRLSGLGKQYGGVFHCSYTGAFPPPIQRALTPVSLVGYTNSSLPDGLAAALRDDPLPANADETAGIPFDLSPTAVIGVGAGMDRDASLPIHQAAGSLYLLHACSRTANGRPVGSVLLRYQDGSSVEQFMLSGQEVLPWTHWQYMEPGASARAIWRHPHPQHLNLQLTVYGLNNPCPEKEIESIQFHAVEEAASVPSWYIFGLTLSDQPAYFLPGPISFGIPDGWGAAAVVYAIIEGLAGVVDGGVRYNPVVLSPRWVAAHVDQAQVTVRYPASDGYVAYHFQHQAGRRALTLRLTGSGQRCTCRVLLPEDALGSVTAFLDGRPVDIQVDQVEQSRYACLDMPLKGSRTLEIVY